MDIGEEITPEKYMEMKAFIEKIYPYLETDQIAQHSYRMDKVRAKLRDEAKKILEK